jgi:hypothetical protein
LQKGERKSASSEVPADGELNPRKGRRIETSGVRKEELDDRPGVSGRPRDACFGVYVQDLRAAVSAWE